MTKRLVPIMRIGYAVKDIEVDADSQEQAEQEALDAAGSHDFSDHHAEYQLASGTAPEEYTVPVYDITEFGVNLIDRAGVCLTKDQIQKLIDAATYAAESGETQDLLLVTDELKLTGD